MPNPSSINRNLAEWVREYDKEKRQTRAPVIMLTGTEMFTPHCLEKGGKYQKLIEHPSVQLDNLRTLADFTQQPYLNMPSYFSWRDAKWKPRAARNKSSVTLSSSERK